MMRRMICGTAFGVVLAAVLPVLIAATDGAWLRRVPAPQRVVQNPYAGDAAAVDAGAALYQRNCVSCHANDARGKRNRPSLRSMRVHDATDGELAWLLKNGNLARGMPEWSRLPEQQRWQIVRYLHSLPMEDTVREPQENISRR